MKFETLFFSVHDEKKYHFNACVCVRACRGSNMSESKSGKTALNDDGTHFTITAKFENIDEKSKPKSTNQGKLKWLLNKISSLGTRTVFFLHIFSVACILVITCYYCCCCWEIWIITQNRSGSRTHTRTRARWHLCDTPKYIRTPGAFFWVSDFPLRVSAYRIHSLCASSSISLFPSFSRTHTHSVSYALKNMIGWISNCVAFYIGLVFFGECGCDA